MQSFFQQTAARVHRWPFAGPLTVVVLALVIGWTSLEGGSSASVSPLAVLPLLVALGVSATPWAFVTGACVVGALVAHTMFAGAALPLADLANVLAATGVAGAVQMRLGRLLGGAAAVDTVLAQVTAQTATLEAQKRRAERILATRRGVFTPFAGEASRVVAETLRLVLAMGDAWREGNKEQAEEHEQRLRHLLRRHQAVAQNVLDGEHLSLGKPIALQSEPVALHTLAQRLVQQLAAPAKASRIKLVVEAKPDLPAASCDPQRIERVVDTLLGNAWQAVQERGSGGTITIAVTQEQSRLRWAVHDTGVGIDADRLKELQHRCVRALLPGSEGDGIGGGVTLMALLVSEMGGDLAISSSGKNLGTTVEFTVPIAQQAGATARVKERALASALGPSVVAAQRAA